MPNDAGLLYLLGLCRNRAESTEDWIWQKQLRYYVKGGSSIIKMSSARFGYSYEYQGNAPKLVHTPLTDKCYLTLTQVTLGKGVPTTPFFRASCGKLVRGWMNSAPSCKLCKNIYLCIVSALDTGNLGARAPHGQQLGVNTSHGQQRGVNTWYAFWLLCESSKPNDVVFARLRVEQRCLSIQSIPSTFHSRQAHSYCTWILFLAYLFCYFRVCTWGSEETPTGQLVPARLSPSRPWGKHSDARSGLS